MSSRRTSFIGLALCVMASAVVPAYPKTDPGAAGPGLVRVDIGGDWQFRQVGREDWHKASVPGCVHTDLMAAGLIPDPFDRDNELKVQWVENENWEYRKVFEVDPAVLKRESVELVCLGLDTFALLTLNGKPVGESDNMFRARRFDVRSLLVPGRNELDIVFESPVKRETVLEAKLPYKIPGNAPHVRKAPYHFGWDWGPRLVTSGIWRPILIEAWDNARLNDLEVVQEFDAKGAVILRVKAGILARAAGKAGLKVSIAGPGGERLVKSRSLPTAAGESSGDLVFKIAKPKLWWPNGMGPQNLYAVRAELSSGKDVLDATVRRVGLRTLVLEQKPDAWGKNFAFVVNGVPFFAKGGNWIPADSFPSRVTRAKYERLLKDCAEVHMNMLRVWGGGIYESPEFYDLCDELGLLVWQDFMFAGQMVPGDEAFRENVRAEAGEVVRALRHHPSIALWCGNNECEEGWFFWGWKDQLPPTLWDDYQKVFAGILAEAVKLNDPGRSYWPSSPHSEKDGDPRSDLSGDMHYWGIWHGKEPFTEYRKKFHRFFSEFGFQSFPLLETVKTFTLPEDRNLASPVMELHQKHPEGNRLILHYMLDEYRLPKDFESLVWLSQVLQAGGMKTAVEHFRSHMPRIMGALYWQIDDVWPVASWSGIDSTGCWKALHYYARRFFAPVLVSPVEEDKNLVVYGVSDLRSPVAAELSWTVFTYEGEVVAGDRSAVNLEPGTSRPIFSKPLADLAAGRRAEDLFFTCELKGKEGTLSSNTFHFSRLKRVSIPDPGVKAEVLEEKGGLVVRLTCARPAKDVHLAAEGLAGRFADNFFDMLPGRTYTVTFLPASPAGREDLAGRLKVRTLRDSY